MPLKALRRQWNGDESFSEQSYQQRDEFAATRPGPLQTTLKTPSQWRTPEKAPAKSSWTSPTSVISESVNSIEDESVTLHHQEQQESDNDSLLRVQVESSLQKTTFYVPVSLMLQREVEMQESAKMSGIRPERWSASRLYSMWKSDPQRRDGGEITLRLDPETVMKDYSDLQWRPWLTSCIRAYYNNGSIRVPDDCLGSDILLALEYFGILTSSPDTFVFESPQVLGRIKAWSTYFTHRNAIADWVVAEYRAWHGSARIWTTSPNLDELDLAETLVEVQGGTAFILGEETSKRGAGVSGVLPSCPVIHNLFYDIDATSGPSRETPKLMRRDFCEYLRRLFDPLSATVAFDVERVKVTKANGMISSDLRAVLRLRVSRDDRVTRAKALVRESREASSRAVNSQKNANGVLAAVDSLDDARSRLSAGLGKTKNSRKAHDGSSGSVESELARVVRKDTIDNAASEGMGVYDKAKGSAGVVYDEQRHPHRSTPPPEGQRAIPEDGPKQTIDNVTQSARAKLHTISDKEFLKQIDNSAPIGYINTAFGDLQSVTSALSEPYLDDSTVGSLSSRFLVQEARRRAMQISDEAEAAPPTGWVDDTENQEQYDSAFEPAAKKGDNLVRPDGSSRSVRSSSVGFVEETKENGNGRLPACSFWDGWLSNMCDGGFSLASEDERRTSPTKSGKQARATPKGDHGQGNPMDQLKTRVAGNPLFEQRVSPPQAKPEDEFDFFARAEELIKTASMEGQAAKEWLQSQLSIDQGSNKAEVHSVTSRVASNDSMVEAAKSIGQSLSNQFFKMTADGGGGEKESPESPSIAYKPPTVPLSSRSRSSPDLSVDRERYHRTSEFGEHQPSDSTPIRRTSVSPRASPLEERGQQTTRTSRRASPDEPMLTSNNAYPQDERRRPPDSDIIALKNRRSEMHTAKSASSKTRPFGLLTAHENVHLPPREPRRARVTQKFGIARKKTSASSSTPFSDDILMRGSAPGGTKNSAKVRADSFVFGPSEPVLKRYSEGRKEMLV